jgi:hypothetical protein
MRATIFRKSRSFAFFVQDEAAKSCFSREVNRQANQLTLRIVICVLLLLPSFAAKAGWQPLGSSAPDGIEYYVNPETKKRNSETAGAWFMTSYSQPKQDGQHPYFSNLVHIQFNCKDDTYRFTSILAYSERMGNGRVVGSSQFPNAAFTATPPTGPFLAMQAYACK